MFFLFVVELRFDDFVYVMCDVAVFGAFGSSDFSMSVCNILVLLTAVVGACDGI